MKKNITVVILSLMLASSLPSSYVAAQSLSSEEIKQLIIKDWFGFKETRFAFMLKAFEHQVHHRGQTTIYIRLQGIRPTPER
jgi:uncharacterized damage-inducible protein DinB